MKKIFLVLTATLLSAVLLRAQETYFGIKGGLNLASIEAEGESDYDSKAGIHFGGLAHIHITRHFAIQPELVYSQQGGEDGDFRLKLGYINVPVMFQYMSNEGFRLQTGPQLGFLVSAETEQGDIEVDVDDVLETVDFSWSFGAGYQFRSGVGIDARYNLALTDIHEANSVEYKNRVFQVGLFYQFMRGKTTRR